MAKKAGKRLKERVALKNHLLKEVLAELLGTFVLVVSRAPSLVRGWRPPNRAWRRVLECCSEIIVHRNCCCGLLGGQEFGQLCEEDLSLFLYQASTCLGAHLHSLCIRAVPRGETRSSFPSRKGGREGNMNKGVMCPGQFWLWCKVRSLPY